MTSNQPPYLPSGPLNNSSAASVTREGGRPQKLLPRLISVTEGKFHSSLIVMSGSCANQSGGYENQFDRACYNKAPDADAFGPVLQQLENSHELEHVSHPKYGQ